MQQQDRFYLAIETLTIDVELPPPTPKPSVSVDGKWLVILCFIAVIFIIWILRKFYNWYKAQR